MQTKLTPFDDLVAQLHQSLVDADPPTTEDPAFGSYLDSHTLLQQLSLTQHFQICIDDDATDAISAANMIKSLALIERTRSRLSRTARSTAQDQPDRDEASQFLETELADGERPAKELISVAQSLGISHRTLKRAKSELNISSRLDCTKGRAWLWSLKSSSTQSAPPISPQ